MTNLPTIQAGPRGLVPTDMDTAWRMAKAIAMSGMAPKSFGQDEQAVAAVFAALQLGAEVGLPPMASVQNIAVINGKPGLYGPAMLAVVEASGKLEDIEETIAGEGDKRESICAVKRVGRRPRTSRFSVADAKRAGLWGKTGPWSQYPDRMLQARARAFALRDMFPDVLLGLAYSTDELIGGGAMLDHGPLPPPRPQRTIDQADALIAASAAGPLDHDPDFDEVLPEGDVVLDALNEATPPAPVAEVAGLGAGAAEKASVVPPSEDPGPAAPVALKLALGANWAEYSLIVQAALAEAATVHEMEAIWKANGAGIKAMRAGGRRHYESAVETYRNSRDKIIAADGGNLQ